MDSPAQRLDKLALSVRQAARILEIPRRILMTALEEDPPPRWLLYSLDGLERALPDNPGLRVRSSDDLPEPLQGDRWAAATARLAIPVLVDAANRGAVLTYKELDQRLRAKDPTRGDSGTLTKYGFALGRVGQAVLDVSEKVEFPIPPIEALVVNGVTEVPGEGIDDFLKAYLIETDRASDAKRLRKARTELIAMIQKEIFDFDNWELFLSEVFGTEEE